MGLRFTVLGSGSTGNAMIVENEDAKLLVDAGMSMKRLEQLMAERGVNAKELSGILVTHEHSDHIKGLGAIARKYNLPVHANERTWLELDRLSGPLTGSNRVVLDTGGKVSFGMLEVESYAISHDAAEPVGYCFHSGGKKLALATDLGYVSDKIKDKLANADVLILESNHDIEMLRVGRYPWNIKRRILSDIGHLSNEAAGDALCELLTGRTKRVYLAHLSREHNMLDLAKLTVNSVLQSKGLYEEADGFRIMHTYYDRSTEWDHLEEN